MELTGSIQEKNGKYHMVINTIDNDGKYKKKWKTTGLSIRGNKKQAEKMLRDTLKELNALDGQVNFITVSSYLQTWLEDIKDDVRPNTFRGYESNMRNHIIPYFENNQILLKDLKPYHLDAYYKFKLKSNCINSDKKLSATSIKHHHQQISKALTDAQRKGYIETNAASLARVPKASKYKASFLEPQEVNTLLSLIEGTSIEIPAKLCAMYGFRRSEVLGLKWQNIDLEKRKIHIVETLQQNTAGDYEDKTKTVSSERTLPITENIYNLLLEHKQLQEGRCKAMGDYYVKSDFVCTFVDGTIISPNYLSRKFNQIIKKSSLPLIRLHDLRHSVASNLLASGFSVVDVQEWMGHANASTTLDIYAHAMKDSSDKLSKKLDEILFYKA